jgi:hypothetical protein
MKGRQSIWPATGWWSSSAHDDGPWARPGVSAFARPLAKHGCQWGLASRWAWLLARSGLPTPAVLAEQRLHPNSAAGVDSQGPRLTQAPMAPPALSHHPTTAPPAASCWSRRARNISRGGTRGVQGRRARRGLPGGAVRGGGARASEAV